MISSSKMLSWKGFFDPERVGLSNSPEVPVPLESELHSIDESCPILKMHDFALKMPGTGAAASSKSNSNSSILGGIAKSSRATLVLILEAFLTGEGL